MKFDIITLFPEMFKGPFSESIIKRAKDKKIINIDIHQLRDFAYDKHQKVDDTPCGGGPGMVLKVDVVDRALAQVKSKKRKGKSRIVMLSASGQKFTQAKAIEMSKYDNIVLLCGHYEGFDQRVHDHLVDEEISIGDYVLTGGEIPAMVLVDAITRMIPGTIKEESIMSESFMPTDNEEHDTHGFISQKGHRNKLPSTDYPLPTNYDYPVYTRPNKYKGWEVPEILLSGDHKKIDEWRKKQQGRRG